MSLNLFNEKKRVIVLGKGKWGKVFISCLKRKVKIIKILRSKDNYKKINCKNIDWIFVLTNTSKHDEICKYFIPKCKNIFCEKPLTFETKKTEDLIKKAKKNKCNLYISDIEKFKENKVRLKKRNIIIRKKFSNDKKDILFRYAYHDLYILSELIDLKNFKKFNLIKNFKGELSYSFEVKKFTFKFIYSFNSHKKIHNINKINFLLFKGNPLDRMIESILSNKENLIKNNINALKSIYIINKIIKKIKD
tara:strand:- start:749 stop:1495 length:747 start_codon:yes stop_codon:yes gene_type:complete